MSDLTSQIAVLETQMKQVIKQVEEGFSDNSKQHEDIIKSNNEGHQEMIKAFKESMDKKAGLWVEKAIIGVVIFVLTAVGTAFMAMVIKQ